MFLDKDKEDNKKQFKLSEKRSVNKYTSMKIISLTLAGLIPFSLVIYGTTKSDGKKSKDDNNTTSISGYYNQEEFFNYSQKYNKEFFGNKKPYYEYEDDYLNDKINDIKNICYNTKNSYFNNYNIYNQSKNAIDRLENEELNNPKNYENNYNWLKNGNINTNILYNKILENTKLNGYQINDEMKKTIRLVSEICNLNIKYIKKMYPKFNFNIAYYNIDNLSVEKLYDNNFFSSYTPSNYGLKINLGLLNNEKDLKTSISHEVFHAITNQDTLGYVSQDAAGFVYLDDNNNPLALDFLLEPSVNDFSYKVFNYKPDWYYEEKARINSLCKSTGKSLDYYENCTFNSNHDGFLNSFESEMQDPYCVFSILDGLNISCGYGSIPDGCNENNFRTCAFNYSRIELLKNGYIKIIKNIEQGKISYDEGNDKIEELKKFVLSNSNYKYTENKEERNELNNCVDKLDNVYNTYCYSFIK